MRASSVSGILVLVGICHAEATIQEWKIEALKTHPEGGFHRGDIGTGVLRGNKMTITWQNGKSLETRWPNAQWYDEVQACASFTTSGTCPSKYCSWTDSTCQEWKIQARKKHPEGVFHEGDIGTGMLWGGKMTITWPNGKHLETAWPNARWYIEVQTTYAASKSRRTAEDHGEWKIQALKAHPEGVFQQGDIGSGALRGEKMTIFWPTGNVLETNWPNAKWYLDVQASSRALSEETGMCDGEDLDLCDDEEAKPTCEEDPDVDLCADDEEATSAPMMPSSPAPAPPTKAATCEEDPDVDLCADDEEATPAPMTPSSPTMCDGEDLDLCDDEEVEPKCDGEDLDLCDDEDEETPAPMMPSSPAPAPPKKPATCEEDPDVDLCADDEEETPAPMMPSSPAPAPTPKKPATCEEDPDVDLCGEDEEETPAPMTPEPKTPAPETPAPETSAPETPAPETPAPETPAPTPAPETPAPTPAPETSAPETPAPETPAPETPAPTPAPETPAPTPAPDDAAPAPAPAAATPAPTALTPAPTAPTPAPTAPTPAPTSHPTQAPASVKTSVKITNLDYDQLVADSNKADAVKANIAQGVADKINGIDASDVLVTLSDGSVIANIEILPPEASEATLASVLTKMTDLANDNSTGLVQTILDQVNSVAGIDSVKETQAAEVGGEVIESPVIVTPSPTAMPTPMPPAATPSPPTEGVTPATRPPPIQEPEVDADGAIGKSMAACSLALLVVVFLRI